nr:MAG TPA: hypothetical protein [Caudoviricetes sp.]
MSNYKRLTDRDITKICSDTGELCGIPQIILRLAELEDKIENGTLIFIDEPFYSDERQCWGVYQKQGDVVGTLFTTEQQAKDYKKFKGINE